MTGRAFRNEKKIVVLRVCDGRGSNDRASADHQATHTSIAATWTQQSAAAVTLLFVNKSYGSSRPGEKAPL